MKKQRVFFDSNLLIYTDDASAPEKHQKALNLLKESRKLGTGVLSTQVLQEYFAVVTRKYDVPAEIARRKIELFSRFDLVRIELSDILAAIDLHRLHQISIWDALIVQAAQQAKCSILYSEDMHHGWQIGSLTVKNPFRES